MQEPTTFKNTPNRCPIERPRRPAPPCRTPIADVPVLIGGSGCVGCLAGSSSRLVLVLPGPQEICQRMITTFPSIPHHYHMSPGRSTTGVPSRLSTHPGANAAAHNRHSSPRPRPPSINHTHGEAGPPFPTSNPTLTSLQETPPQPRPRPRRPPFPPDDVGAQPR